MSVELTQLSVSVVIPCYNYGRFLSDALGSVLLQSRPVDQIILVDDGSTDDSARIARAIVPNITIISQLKQGIASARNSGMAAATSDLIAFLDADDIWPLDSISSRITPLESNPALAGSFGLVEQFLCPMLGSDASSRLNCPPGVVPARLMGALLVRRAIAQQIGAFNSDFTIGESIDWIARLSDFGAQIAPVDKLVLRRRIHGSNTVLNQNNYTDYFAVMRAALHRRADAGSASDVSRGA